MHENILRRVAIFLLLIIVGTLFLSVQAKAVEWTSDEVLELVGGRLSKDMERKIEESEKEISELKEDRSQEKNVFFYFSLALIVIVTVILLYIDEKKNTLYFMPILLSAWILISLSYVLKVSTFPYTKELEELQSKQKIEIEHISSTEYVSKTIEDVVSDIYSSGDTIESLSKENATKEVKRKFGIKRGEIISQYGN